ncbi:MAG: hypothetical protein ACRCTE_06425 [Cellulosilyticaceae bacterium]
MAQSTLSPPWYEFRNKVYYTIGCTPGVTVSDLISVDASNYNLNITVSSCTTQASALRAILPQKVSFGGTNVNIHVFYMDLEISMPTTTPTTPADVAQLFCNALYNNPYFKGLVLTTGVIPDTQRAIVGDVVLIITPSVIQFYDDNLADLCSNFNGLATDVFKSVITTLFGTITVGTSTYSANCSLLSNMCCSYC